jgi:hypothetical protein
MCKQETTGNADPKKSLKNRLKNLSIKNQNSFFLAEKLSHLIILIVSKFNGIKK